MTTTTRPPVSPMTPPTPQPVNHAAIAAQIAVLLGETEPRAQAEIRRIMHVLGHRQTIYLAQSALAIQAAGGLLVNNGTRSRTTGGIFFWLAYTTGQPKPGMTLARPEQKRAESEKKTA